MQTYRLGHPKTYIFYFLQNYIYQTIPTAVYFILETKTMIVLYTPMTSALQPFGSPLMWSGLPRDNDLFANLSVRSPQKLYIFIGTNNIDWI